ncbi:zinc finger HIT domain-containing protein 2 [Rhinophrynus dorsalis]
MEALVSEVLIPTRSSSPTPAISPAKSTTGDREGPVVCALCLSGPGKYTCPRCNAPYCSLTCYRGPRHQVCSEDFYRESVIQMLQEDQAEPRGRRQVEEMLLKLRKEEESGELGLGLDGVHELEKEEGSLWDRLTPRERQEFHKLIKNGGIGALIPEWRPWWETEGLNQDRKNPKITELPKLSSILQDGAERDSKILPQSSNIRRIKGKQEDENSKVARLPMLTNELPIEIANSQNGLEKPNPDITRLPELTSLPGDCQERKTQDVTILPKLATDVAIQQESQITNTAKIKCSPDIHTGQQGDLKKTAYPERVVPCANGHDRSHPIANRDCCVRHTEQGRNTLAERSDGVQGEELENDTAEKRSLDLVCQSKLSQVPTLFRSLPSLHSLSHNPSPLVRYSLVNAIYGYAFSLMRHNGDVYEDDMLLDFTGTLLGVSGSLSSAVVYSSTALALQSAVHAASDPLLGGDEGGACSAIKATSQILLGEGSKRYVLAALAHLSRMLGRARKLAVDDKDLRRVAFNAKKKCMFMASWVNENEECLTVLYEEVRREHTQHLKYISGVTEISRGLQKAWGGKRPPEKKILIQEVDLNQM